MLNKRTRMSNPACSRDADCNGGSGVMWASTDTYRACIDGTCASNPRDPELDGGTIALIVIACIVVVALVASLVALGIKHHRRPSPSP